MPIKKCSRCKKEANIGENTTFCANCWKELTLPANPKILEAFLFAETVDDDPAEVEEPAATIKPKRAKLANKENEPIEVI